MQCYDCGRKTNNFRCNKCLKLLKEGKIKYLETGKWGRINHFGARKQKFKVRDSHGKIKSDARLLEEVMNSKPSSELDKQLK